MVEGNNDGFPVETSDGTFEGTAERVNVGSNDG
eukprot:CAMPEP_0194270210 /NCGR_PEP_ID=MMETSP0169-20130528/4242_1 /TAXON_ID=218684 /ORGANISM="Corethron pennatum, Strain L29A3" /LENGTH=32 /DNA_ID= /DNA_START= /DNA_END= /DNA_ORIENTATION=